MNDGIRSFVIFSVGAAVGSVVAWKLLEKKYKQIADDEINSVKEVFDRKLQRKVDEEIEKRKHEMLGDVIKTFGYTPDEKTEKEEKRDMAEDTDVYVIPPESFGEIGYETESLTYYADKVLTNDLDEIIENVDELVGKNSLETFGEYEDDSVFVRNDRLKKDFEILLDMRNYHKATSDRKPHLVNDDD